jgi:lipopolysaccharide heptosyltransferase II
MTAGPFVKKLSEKAGGLKVMLSVMTDGGYAAAKSLGLPVEHIFYLPLDFAPFAGRVIRAVRPRALVLVEAEFWPGLVLSARRAGVRVFMVNARFSDKSSRFIRFFPRLSKKVLGGIETFFARERKDEQWLLAFGIPAVRIVRTGNMKYDLFAPQGVENGAAKALFGFTPQDLVFTAGSVREGEEESVISAFGVVRSKKAGLKMIYAPRHLGRVGISEKILQRMGVKSVRFSDVRAGEPHGADCVIVDTFGRLKDAYAAADAVFVGGGLAPRGGQNIIEPALIGRAVIFGPYMSSFEEPAEVLKKSGGGIEVLDSRGLAEKITELVSDPGLAARLGAKAMEAAASMAGASERNVRAVADALAKNRKRILIIQPSRIGDVIFSLPFLANLRRMYPDAFISWLVDDRCASLLDNNPHLDEKIVFPFKKLGVTKPFYSARGIKKLASAFALRGFDLSIDLHGLAKSAFVAALSGAREKIGSASTYGMKEFSWLVSREIRVDDPFLHTIERHFAVLRYLMSRDSGALPVTDFAMEFPLPEGKDESEYVEGLLRSSGIAGHKRIVAALTGGGWKSRRWPPEKFSHVCDLLAEKCGAAVVLIGGAPGGSPEEGIIRRVVSGMKTKPHDFSGKMTLKQLVAFLRKCALYFGNEAGPMHIACALGIPVAAIIGPTDPHRTGPFGDNFSAVRKEVPCAPCKERNCRRMECMARVSVEDAFGEARRLLEGA